MFIMLSFTLVELFEEILFQSFQKPLDQFIRALLSLCVSHIIRHETIRSIAIRDS